MDSPANSNQSVADNECVKLCNNARISPSENDISQESKYANYVLLVLMVVGVLNYLDRQIMTILIEDIKADLQLSDSDVGFLVGTAFAIFYATFGLALARLADIWDRTKLISLGLGVWSLMTACTGLAQNFYALAACRFGVGVGESCAAPASVSLLYDSFPPKVRTTVIGIFGCGPAIGGALGVFMGGSILDAWHASWPDVSNAPFGLKGWQVALLAAGIPGVLVSFWVATLREPVRGFHDGIVSTPNQQPFHETLTVLISMIPLLNLFLLHRLGKSRQAILLNIVILAVIIAGAYNLTLHTGNALQWWGLAVGFYAASSWVQFVWARDVIIYSLIFRCKTMVFAIAGMAVSLSMAGAMIWGIPFLQRYHGASPSDIGFVIGIGSFITGITGALLGGYAADKLRTKTAKGKLLVTTVGILLTTLAYVVLLTSSSLTVAYTAILFGGLTFGMSQIPLLSTLNDLMLPRGRATVSAFHTMLAILCGSALAPYVVGLLSDGIHATGVVSSEALRQGMLWSLLGPVIGLILLLQAIRNVEQDEATLLHRAQALGEKI